MTQSKDIPITPGLKAYIGREISRYHSQPIALSDIRKWAIAVYWPETPPRLYWDADYAKKTRFGGVIAPEDFNPFGWPVEKPKQMDFSDIYAELKKMGNSLNVLNGGGGAQFLTPMRPGDVITSVTIIDDIYYRQGTKWPMSFIIRKTTWTNQKGETVRISTNTQINY